MTPSVITRTSNPMAAILVGCLLSSLLCAAEPVINGDFDPALIDSPIQDPNPSATETGGAAPDPGGSDAKNMDSTPATTADVQHRPLGKRPTTIIESGPTTPLTESIAPLEPLEPPIETSQQAAVEPEDSKQNVRRALFTSGITDREPVDDLISLGNEISKVYFFTEVRGLAGQKIIHRWLFQDQIFAEVEFAIGGPRWRVWSSKNLPSNYIGEWQVLVVDENGAVLSKNLLVYTDSASP